MKKKFREYHQFTNEEYQQLWKNCLFVFDTNTLLNMYRYSRATVDTYFDVLSELKKKKQLWIPYQVGYEFYENRLSVISEYEKSYHEILSILEKAKNDIDTKYKNHPFLNLGDIKKKISDGLSDVEKTIKHAQEKHPKWLEKDDVLEKVNQLFDGAIGDNYSEKKLDEIKEEGKVRYAKKIPPGFKDDIKGEDKKYGDLIIWFQMIDKAKESKRPIVFISGDVKEDWWLEKDGKRIMPLPQLKKEMLNKSEVDFHIYPPDRFLELNKSGKKTINNTIEEVRNFRESEEIRTLLQSKAKNFKLVLPENDSWYDKRNHYYYHLHNPYLKPRTSLNETLDDLIILIDHIETCLKHNAKFYSLLLKIKELIMQIRTSELEDINQTCIALREIIHILDKLCDSKGISIIISRELRKYGSIIISYIDELELDFLR